MWEDSAFGDISTAMREYLVFSGYPALLEPAAVVMARLTAGDDLTAKSPLGAIPAYAGRPLAIVHGTDDTTVLVSHAEALHDRRRGERRRHPRLLARRRQRPHACRGRRAGRVRAPPGPVLRRGARRPLITGCPKRRSP